MTNAEYYSEYANLRHKLAKLTLQQRKQLLSVYETAAQQAGEVLKTSLTRGLSQLTSNRWAEIESQLKSSAQVIADYTDTAVKSTLSTGLGYVADIDTEYITSAVNNVGARITGLNAMY